MEEQRQGNDGKLYPLKTKEKKCIKATDEVNEITYKRMSKETEYIV